jgi:hypothetical protein
MEYTTFAVNVWTTGVKAPAPETAPAPAPETAPAPAPAPWDYAHALNYARRALRNMERKLDGTEEDIAQSAFLLYHKSRKGGRKPLDTRGAARRALAEWLRQNGTREWYVETPAGERYGPYASRRSAFRFLRSHARKPQERSALRSPPPADTATYRVFTFPHVSPKRLLRSADHARALRSVVEDYCGEDSPAAVRHLLAWIASGATCADAARDIGVSEGTARVLLHRFLKRLPRDLFVPVPNAEKQPAPRLGDARQAGTPRRDAETPTLPDYGMPHHMTRVFRVEHCPDCENGGGI